LEIGKSISLLKIKKKNLKGSIKEEFYEKFY